MSMDPVLEAIAETPPPQALLTTAEPTERGGRPGVPVASKLEAAALIAQGKTQAEVQAVTGVSKGSIHRIVKSAGDYIDRIRRLAQRKVLRGIGATMDALLASSQNQECRHQPQAARVAGELAGVIGTQVHIGDNVQVTIDGRSVHYHGVATSDVAASLDDARRSLNL